MQRMPIAPHQLPDDVDALKSLLVDQLVRNEQADSDVIILSGQQLNWLLDGYDVMRFKPHERLHYSSVL